MAGLLPLEMGLEIGADLLRSMAIPAIELIAKLGLGMQRHDVS